VLTNKSTRLLFRLVQPSISFASSVVERVWLLVLLQAGSHQREPVPPALAVGRAVDQRHEEECGAQPPRLRSGLGLIRARGNSQNRKARHSFSPVLSRSGGV